MLGLKERILEQTLIYSLKGLEPDIISLIRGLVSEECYSLLIDSGFSTIGFLSAFVKPMHGKIVAPGSLDYL